MEVKKSKILFAGSIAAVVNILLLGFDCLQLIYFLTNGSAQINNNVAGWSPNIFDLEIWMYLFLNAIFILGLLGYLLREKNGRDSLAMIGFTIYFFVTLLLPIISGTARIH